MSRKKFKKALNRYINNLENELREIETDIDIRDIDLFESDIKAVESVDDDEEFDDYPPILYVPHNVEPEKEDFTERGARRNSKIAKLVAKEKGLIVIDGVHVYAYIPECGCYKRLTDAQLKVTVESVLPENVSEALSNKAMVEIVDKIKRNPQLQRTKNFNSNPFEINCLNGVVNFDGGVTGLREHSPQDLFDYSIAANYIYFKERGVAESFEKFCNTTFPEYTEEKRQLLLEMLGYIFSDSMAGKCMLLGVGAPNSGKSVMADFIGSLFDDVNKSGIAPHELATDFNKGRLFGKKVNILPEVSSKELRGVDVLKSLTSGDTVTGAFKGKDSFEFANKAKLMYFANSFPVPVDVDPTDGFYNRLVVLRFTHSIEEGERDPLLRKKLLYEKDIIVSLAIDAYVKLVERNFIFTLPKDSETYLENYKNNLNSFELFKKEKLRTEMDAKIHSKELFSHYNSFCAENGLDALKPNEVRQILREINGVKLKKVYVNGKSLQGASGIGLKTEIIDFEEDAG